MPKKLASLLLSLLILFKSVPVHAIAIDRSMGTSDGEKALGIGERFFDGSGLDLTADIQVNSMSLDCS
ncbi:MAG: hypothetical protein AABZ44_05305, partial [Elusimicrobiota bacterium]